MDTFHFTAPHVLVHQAPYGSGNAYSVRSNGLEIRLDWVVSTLQETWAKLCYQQSHPPSLKLKAYAGWTTDQNTPTAFGVLALQPQQVMESPAEPGWRCVEAVFPPLP